MAAPAADTIMVIGSRSASMAGASDSNGGGASKDVWKANTPADFMGADGSPIYSTAGATWDGSVMADNAIGLNIVDGTLVRVSGGILSGIFIGSAVTANSIALAGASAPAGGGYTVKVGGALATLQAGLDNPANDPTDYNRYLYYNADEILTAAIDNDVYPGGTATKRYIIGMGDELLSEEQRTISASSGWSGKGLVDQPRSRHEWRNIDFNASGIVQYAFSASAGGSYNTWKNCIFRNATSHGVYDIAGITNYIGCEMYGNGGSGVYSTVGQPKHIHCVAHDNASHGFAVLHVSHQHINCRSYDNGGDGFYASAAGDRLLYDGCLAFGNTGDGFDLADGSLSNTLYNNTSSGNGGYGFNLNGQAVEPLAIFSNNHAHNNTSGHCSECVDDDWVDFYHGDNITGDPLFASVVDGSEDFTIQVGSPLIDAGFAPIGTKVIGPIDQVPDFPDAANVLSDDTTNGATGTFTAPAVGDVQDGVQFGAGSTEFEGTLELPAVSDVQDGVQFGAEGTEFEGTLGLPAAGDVQDGVGFGEDGSEFEGTLELPAVGDVQTGVQFGAAGTEFTGTLDLPAEANVIDGIGFGASGTEFEGSYDNIPPNAPTLVLTSAENIASAVITGDANVTNYVFYKAAGESAWTLGGSCSGDGTIEVEDLDDGIIYTFIAYSIDANSLCSAPSVAFSVSFSADATSEFDGVIDDTADYHLDAFAETITYFPSGGGSRSIRAIINRNDSEAMGSGIKGHGPLLTITVANRTDDGISAAEVNTGGDKVTLVVRIGETAQSRRIIKIVDCDYGMMRLEVR